MERFNPYRAFAGCVLPSWLLRARDVSMGAKLAYARLAQYAGETGVAWPTVATLGAELGVSERQARSYLAELRGHRLIEQEDDPQHRSSSKFFFLRHPWMETNPDRGAGSCPPEGKNPSGQGGRILPPRGEESFRSGGKDPAPKENQGRESGKRITSSHDSPSRAGAHEAPRCGDVEDASAVNGLDAAMALRAASGGALRTSATPTQALALGAALTTLQRQHRRADLVDLLGAYAAAGGFAWMTQRRPTTAWLLERDGGNLADAIEQALAWDAAGRGAVAARAPPHRVSDVRRGRLEAADAEAFAQVDDATLFGRDRPA